MTDSTGSMAPCAVQDVVRIPYHHLQERTTDLSEALEAGFGPNSLGIVAISGVPRFSNLRKDLLMSSEKLAYLADDAKQELEDPLSRYSFGWSHGKEILESGKPDHLKGSFYANPFMDVPTNDPELMERYPSYCRPNLWPSKHLPELEQNFKALGQLMIDIGLLLASHCDKYVLCKGALKDTPSLTDMLKKSKCHKGRLLHYFQALSDLESQAVTSWCGWHVDHSCLTGLTSAMYTKQGKEIPCLDPEAGLYIKTRSGVVVKANFQEDEIAYQMGQATEIMSGGLLHATPHCVRAARGLSIERNTFALFMQPHWDEPLREKDILNNMVPVVTFGDFTEETLSKHYKQYASFSDCLKYNIESLISGGILQLDMNWSKKMILQDLVSVIFR